MKSSKKLSKLILQLLVLVLVGGYLTTSVIQSTFASDSNNIPNVILTINSDGSITYEGNLFGDDELYPATVESAEKGDGGVNGVIRINNQYKRIKVSNLGIGLDAEKLEIKNGYPRDVVYNSFLTNVELKIEKGRLFSFDKTLVDYISLKDLLYEPGSKTHKGYELDSDSEFIINKGSTVDLKYTLHMVEDAGEELEAVTASIPIYINVHEFKPIDDDYGDNDNYDDYDKRDTTTTIETKSEPQTEEKKHWAHDCIITLLNHRIIHGYTSDTVSLEDYLNGTIDPVTYVNEVVHPERYITRAETAVLIGRSLGLQEEYAESTGYLDPIPDWARGYVIATTRANIFTGYPTGVFKPNNYITREEMIAVLTRAFNITLKDETLELPFKDKDDIGEWAVKYVKAGYESGVIVGYPDNTYRPKNPITRAETFTIICKLLGLHYEHAE